MVSRRPHTRSDRSSIKEQRMSTSVYAVSEIVGSSPDTIEDAIETALARASKTLRNLDWFVVTETRGLLDENGGVAQYQVTLKLGFRMED